MEATFIVCAFGVFVYISIVVSIRLIKKQEAYIAQYDERVADAYDCMVDAFYACGEDSEEYREAVRHYERTI